MKYLPVFILFVILLACLEEPDCLHEGDTALVIDFRKLLKNEKDTLILDYITGEGADSVFYLQKPADTRDTLTSAIVAVNPFSNETLFTFYFPLTSKTLRVGYQTDASFISEECGSEQIQRQLVILETEFDSVRVVNNVLSSSRTTNIEIFR